MLENTCIYDIYLFSVLSVEKDSTQSVSMRQKNWDVVGGCSSHFYRNVVYFTVLADSHRLTVSLPSCSEPHSGVRVRRQSSADPRDVGSSATGSGAAIYGWVRCHTERTRSHCDPRRQAELHHPKGPGAGHPVPGHSQRSTRERQRESHVCEGLHHKRCVFNLFISMFISFTCSSFPIIYFYWF